ncbi:MAG TPA: metallophosphoesterase family protein [Mycobacteriales bacterium]|nr:metallophosphoesterase family protein [Mycobacteriales bacterium]
MGISHEDRPYVSRRQFLQRSAAVSGAAVLTSATPLFWQQPAYAAGAPVSHLHLQFGADAAHEATVSWRTTSPVKTPFVEVDGTRVRATTRQYPGYAGGWFHSARLKGLHAATTYRYRVGHAGQALTGDRLTTGPSGRQRFTWTGFGDQGYSVPTAGRNDAHHNTKLAQRIDPALHAIVGDLAYANGDQAIWDQWMGMVSPMARRRPWMPCIGNHEIESQLDPVGLLLDTWGDHGYDPYRTRFDLPGNGHSDLSNCFYRFRYGSVEFLSIDNNDVTSEIPLNVGYTGGRQKAWVESTLKRAAADPAVDFIVVLMHQAAFSSSSKHGSDLGVQTTWLDLFSKYGVDLVLQGHDHVYERTHAMRGMAVADDSGPYRTDTGTVFVLVGNGGGVQEPFKPLQPDWSAFRKEGVIGTLRVDVDPFGPKGMSRLVLGEYAAADGRPVEKGIILERPHRHPRARTTAAQPPYAQPQSGGRHALTPTAEHLPATGGLPGVAAVGMAAAGAAAALRVTVGRLREPDADELQV